MATTITMYSKFLKALLNAQIPDLDAGGTVLKLALLGSTYTPNQETDELWSGISSHEISGAGYTTGGMALTGKAIAEAARVANLDADDVVWTGATLIARYGVLYEVSSGRLIQYADFGENKSATGGTFSCGFDVSGIFAGTVAV